MAIAWNAVEGDICPGWRSEIVVPYFDFFRIVQRGDQELRPHFDPGPLKEAASA